MNPLPTGLSATGTRIKSGASKAWKQFRGLKTWVQALIVAALVALIVGGIVSAKSGTSAQTAPQERTVTLSSVSSLSGDGENMSILGTVQSVSEAQLSAQAGGTVKAVYAKEGDTVAAGSIIAELDNSSESAAVLQAEGAYDAAVAARVSAAGASTITGTQATSAKTALSEAATAARTQYRSTYTTLDSTLENDVDTFYGSATPTGPQLLINRNPNNNLSQKREELGERLDAWKSKLSGSADRDPIALLDQATTDTQAFSGFLVALSDAANTTGSQATPTQITALAQARATIDGQLAALSGARDAYNAKKTAAQIGATTVITATQIPAADAQVKQALGILRGAQANLEKTRIRATIGGTLNFLSLHVGDYVGAFTHVATVAQNGALEIVAYVPDQNRNDLATGMSVMIEGGHSGTVTSVGDALDPITKQIEVHVAVQDAPELINGQSVRISFPQPESQAKAVVSTSTSATPPSVQLLPLTALKLMTSTRAVFSVDADGRLVAHDVTIGDVVGDRIQVTTPLDPTMLIVTDVRGLSEGQKVLVSTSTPTQ